MLTVVNVERPGIKTLLRGPNVPVYSPMQIKLYIWQHHISRVKSAYVLVLYITSEEWLKLMNLVWVQNPL